ncbi:Uncharacterized protein Fot_56544 [Forsythia ovata]|uniref:Uncharacterized protein n=1 Tax=Forsythia ovata TaxID=205694 RepID=A0ABD1P1C4_9LAMI
MVPPPHEMDLKFFASGQRMEHGQCSGQVFSHLPLSESFLTLPGLLPGNQRPRLWQQSPLRENENIHEKPQLHEIWCGQSYLYMPYGTYGLGEIRASLIPLAELNSVKPVLQVRARALLSFLRLFPSEGQVK